MINIPKKPPPSYLVTIGIPFAMLFTVFSFQRVGFNLQDFRENLANSCLLYTSPSPRDKRQSRMPSSA